MYAAGPLCNAETIISRTRAVVATSRLRADKIEDDKRERQRFHAKPDPMSAA